MAFASSGPLEGLPTDTHRPSVRLARLHAAVQRGDRAAVEELSASVLDKAFRVLRRRWRNTDPALVNDAIVDALLRYLASPTLYDPRRSRLDTFLVALAFHRLRCLVRGERRRRSAESQNLVATVEPNYQFASGPVRLALARDFTARERLFLEAWLRGENRRLELARLLGADQLPDKQQRRLVKRTTERLRIRLRRLGRRLAGQASPQGAL